MKRDNSNLSKAKQNKNDEFYTLYESIEKEIKQFNLKGKKIFCNCDSPDSNFYKYFKDKYNEIGLSGLVAIGYSITDKTSFKITYDGENETKENIIDGSFESEESINELKNCDIVITNPPFSKYRNWFDVVYIQNKKDFINIGTINMVTYKKVFPYIKEEKLIVYDYSLMYFKKPDGTDFKLNSCWFSTIKKEWPDKVKQLKLTKKYYDNPEEYPKYDNYDAINVDKTSDIPIDYYGVMGVPITYLGKHNPDQFEIVAFRKGEDGNVLVFTRERERENSTITLYPSMTSIPGMIKNAEGKINGKPTYARITIRRISNQ